MLFYWVIEGRFEAAASPPPQNANPLTQKKRTDFQYVLIRVNDGSRTHDLRNHNPTL